MTTVQSQTKQVPLEACRLGSEAVQFELLADDPGQPTIKRQWSMLANTGAVVQRWWGSLVLDLAGARYPQRLALLLDHSTDSRIGFSTEVKRTERGLEAKGRLLENELANQVLAESRQGFPWQASLMAVPSRVQVLDDGEETEVNGRQVLGPASIFREWDVRELTLTVLGADPNTATEAFAADGGEIPVEFLTMVKKTNDEPAKPATSTQDLASPPAAPATETTGASATATEDPQQEPNLLQAERDRVRCIREAADASQAQLALDLIQNGTPKDKALAALAADTRQKLEAMRLQLERSGQPLSAGNTSGGDGSGTIVPAQLRAAPADEDQRKELWRKSQRLRGEFTYHGESEEAGLRRFHAYAKFCAKYLKPDEQLQAFRGIGEALALETHLQPLTERGVRGDFHLGLESRDTTWLSDIASVYQTDAPFEVYPFLGVVGRLVKWEGERQVQTPNRGKLTVVNDDFEGTIAIEGKDWRRDKTGQLSQLVTQMGDAAAEKPIDMINDLLNASLTTATTWDGKALFANDHVWGSSGTIDNLLGTVDQLAGGADPTSAQMAKNIFVAIQRLMSFKDDKGRPMNQSARNFVVMVPLNMLGATEAALTDQFTSAGVSNTLGAMLERGRFTIRPVFNPALTATNRFYLWRTDARVKPFVYQEEFVAAPYLLGPGTEHFRRTNKAEIGAHMACGAAPGKFELIVAGVTS